MAGNRNSGRRLGDRNKVTREIKELCQSYGPEMVEGLVRLAKGAESEAARVAAMKEVLDRGYGKAPQHVSIETDAYNMTGEQLARELASAAAELRSIGVDPALLESEAGPSGPSGSQLTH